MRTTLTIDDDVAVQVDRLRRERDASLKDVVNDLLRHGLSDLQKPAKRRAPFKTTPIDVGEVLIQNIDNIEELLTLIEGEVRK